MDQDERGTRVSLDMPSLKVNFRRQDNTDSHISVDAQGAQLKLHASFNGAHESLYWAQPLADDKLTDFETWKRAGIALEPFEYDFKGQRFSCGRN